MFFQTTVSSLYHSWSGQIGTPQTAERDSASVEVRAQDLGLQLDLAHSVGTSVWSFGGSTLLIGVSPGLMTVSRSRSGRTLANSPQPMEVEEEDLLSKWPSHQRDIIPWR